MEKLNIKKVFSVFAGLLWLPFALLFILLTYGIATSPVHTGPYPIVVWAGIIGVFFCMGIFLLWPLALTIMSLFFKKGRLLRRGIRRGILIFGVVFLLLILPMGFIVGGAFEEVLPGLGFRIFISAAGLAVLNNIIWYLHAKNNPLPAASKGK